MQEPQVFLSGRWIAQSAAGVPLTDAGFVLGVTVAEQLRTFGGRVFHLEDHIARLYSSLAQLGINPQLTPEGMAEVAREIVARNYPLAASGDDLGLSIFATPGIYPSYSPPGPIEPMVCLHTYELPFRFWAEKYRTGESLAIPEVRQVPQACWPASLKCRSRMHYYLADRRAAELVPGARALLLDQEGFVTEASTANVLVYRRGEGLVSPPIEKVLHGISLAVAFDIARKLGIPTLMRELRPEDVATADEVILSSTPLCLLPVTRLDGRPIGDGRPGAVFGQLMAAWNAMAGIDIVAQARQFAVR